MTDLDEDGDLDLFSTWENFHSPPPSVNVWIIALNDGRGTFETVHIEKRIGRGIDYLHVGDLTGDGQDEIATRKDSEITVWSIGPDLQMEVLTQIQDRWLVDMVDWDGDGRLELFTTDFTMEEVRALEVWEVEQGVVDDHPVGGHRKLFSLADGRLYRRWAGGHAVVAERPGGQVGGSGLGRRAGGGRGRL